MSLTIIKCGGSLLTLPDLPLRLLALLDCQAPKPAMIVVGGGAAADIVRDWDRRYTLSDQAAHDLAIYAMTLNARMLVSAHPRFHAVTHFKQAVDLPANGVAVLMPDKANRLLETQHAPLPRSWNVTSDSIAAWLATILKADLWLLKSVHMPNGPNSHSVAALTQAGLVDPCFSEHSAAVSCISWCNLQAAEPTIQRLEIAADDGNAAS